MCVFVHLKRCNIPSISHLVLGGTQEPPAFPLCASALRTLAHTHTPPPTPPPTPSPPLCNTQASPITRLSVYSAISAPISTKYTSTELYLCTPPCTAVQTNTSVLTMYRHILVYYTMYTVTGPYVCTPPCTEVHGPDRPIKGERLPTSWKQDASCSQTLCKATARPSHQPLLIAARGRLPACIFDWDADAGLGEDTMVPRQP